MSLDMSMVAGLIEALGDTADPEVIEKAVSDWLDDHPEATTTVEDGSITAEKLASALAAKIGEIDTLSEAIGMNGTAVVVGTGNPVSVQQIGATASVESEAAKYLMVGKNLFSAGDQTVSVFKSVALPCKFPAGKYSLSCICDSTDTDSDVCTINLFNGSTAAATGKSIYRGYRTGATFTATTEFDNIYFYASNTFAHSTGDTATFKDILLEVGEDKTEFEEYRGVEKNVSDTILMEHQTETFYTLTGENLTVSYIQVSPESMEGRIETLTQKVEYPYTNFYGKTIVNFGDSIFANGVTDGTDISTYIKQKTGATVYNCAFGGCRMGYQQYAEYDAFSMYKLVDAITTNTWTEQDAGASDQDVPSYFATTLATLKTIDFSKVDIVTIAYGTNDFTGGLGIGGETKYYTDWALQYSIETLLTAYPNLRIFVCVPMYRVWLNGTTFDEDSNTKECTATLAGGATNKLTDFAEAETNICKGLQIPVLDNYYDLGINKFNWTMYFPATDGTHPNKTGRKLIAEYIASKLW